jgi:type II secretory pathway component PulK
MTAERKKLKTELNDQGMVLIVVLVLLVVLCAVAYALTLSVSAYRKRCQYMIDYQAARYACDSAVKYALATLQDINEPVVIARPNEPDFSDLFTLDQQEYRQLLADWAESINAAQALKHQKKIRNFLRTATNTSVFDDSSDSNDLSKLADINGLTAFALSSNLSVDLNDPNNLQVPGPYGPPWPLITEPLNLVIGDAAVTIEIHDENAKYPIGWMMIQDKTLRPQIQAGFETFCEWMDVNKLTINRLEEELTELNKIKEYKLEFKDITITKRQPIKVPRRTARTRRSRRSRTRYRTTKTKIPAAVQLTDFARLYHSSFIDTETLARPVIIAEDRTESALKYISLWPITAVNINTAPRNVLEAFAFGGLSASVDIADGVIQRRRIKPFEDPDEIRSALFRYGDSIEKCRQYIVAKSDVFTIRIIVNRGLARTSAVIAVKNNKGKMEKIAVLSG